MESGKYFLGLDIGSDSVGYAVTGTDYRLLKYHGEPMWGAMTFEEGGTAEDRRAHRTARRRTERTKQRIDLLNELFADEICKIDPNFFIRRKESSLFPEDSTYGVSLFHGRDLTDREYHHRYPTIHHLILDLMTSKNPHDVRLVYLACSWLIAHRGHFLSDVSVDNVKDLMDFNLVYDRFKEFIHSNDYDLPWINSVSSDDLSKALSLEGVSQKKSALKALLYGGKNPSKTPDERFPYSQNEILELLSGSLKSVNSLCPEQGYEELGKISLSMGDEDFMRICGEMQEDDAELLINLRALTDCVELISVMETGIPGSERCLSASKVAVYEQHKKDLKNLKTFVRKYCPRNYNEIFRSDSENTYTAYSHHLSGDQKKIPKKWASKDAFSDYLKKKLKNIKVDESDQSFFADMMARLEDCRFLPKQKDTDNRIIPMQLYYYELDQLLENAASYLPFLSEKDTDGLSPSEKIRSIFVFRIPYFVGPLNGHSNHAWLVRKAEGKILPWNLKEKVDFDASEQAFISRMTNTCTYLPGEAVLPENSLLYCRFQVLNELNNLKLNGNPIPVEEKQELFSMLFKEKRRVTPKMIRTHLHNLGKLEEEDVLSGIDETFKSSLSSYHQFKKLLDSKTLSERQVENIIEHAAYSEDKGRMAEWLKREFPSLSPSDQKYIVGLKLKGFGRLSKKLLNGLEGCAVDVKTGEVSSEPKTILQWMWDTNENFMQLMSDRYTFAGTIREEVEKYCSEHSLSLTDRLSERYLSGNARRPIIRTLEIVKDIHSVMKGAPEKIFVEMARGSTPDQKGKRTKTRRQQLLDLYRQAGKDSRDFEKSLENVSDNRLQSDKIFLYYLQMGRCLYTGAPIDLDALINGNGDYNIEHIYPRKLVKDDSILNNLILVDSKANGQKSDTFPISSDIQRTMRSIWEHYHKMGLLTDEKYRRLTRTTGFTAEERMGFINRQLVETRQSTKAVAELLKEYFPSCEIVYVKAGLASEFRQEFELIKCREVNDLHHAKDAYLNIVVGNVYHERFTKKWFDPSKEYNVKIHELMVHSLAHGKEIIWPGESGIALIKKTMAKNAVHLTRYTFCRKGGLFDQQPNKAQAGLIPLKSDLPTEKYGGYNKSTASFYVLASFTEKKKQDIMFVPIELMAAERFEKDPVVASEYVREQISLIRGGKEIKDVTILLNGRKIKINTILSLDGLQMTIAGKCSNGTRILLSPLSPLILSSKQERYVKRLVSFSEKQKVNKSIQLDSAYDMINAEENLDLYKTLTQKLEISVFSKLPNNQHDLLLSGIEKFEHSSISDQIPCLLNLVQLLQKGSAGVDLKLIGGSSQSGIKLRSAVLSNWNKYYSDVRLIDTSPAGLHESVSENLLTLL